MEVVPSLAVPAPTVMRARRSGTLKVVLPSPAPDVVPMALNRSEYVVLLTALPSQTNQPPGTTPPANSAMAPIGESEKSSVSSWPRLAFQVEPHVSGLAPTAGLVRPRCVVSVSLTRLASRHRSAG